MPDCFFVMHEGFLQLALLLKDAGKVGVSCSKLWKHLFNTHTNLNMLQENGSWVYVELQTGCDKRILIELQPQELSCTAGQHLQYCLAPV